METATSPFPVRYGSEGNLRMSELLIKAADAVAANDHRPGVLIGSVVLDGLRWVDPRAEIAAQSRVPAIRKSLDAVVAQHADLPQAARVVASMGGSAQVQTSGTPRTLHRRPFDTRNEGMAARQPPTATRLSR